jgi:hypothetical protein
MASHVAAVVAALGACLVEASPARPVQHGLGRGQDAHHHTLDEATDLGKGDRDQLGVLGQELSHGGPPLGSAAARAVASGRPGSRERTTAR